MRVTFPIQAAGAVLVSGILAGGCSQSPIAPSELRGAARPTTVESTAADSPVTTQAASFSPADFVARGWDCHPAPTLPSRVTCSPPNQVHPVLLPGPPPPADRPATLKLFVFDSGVFVGTTLLIRSDLYNGQQCSSTGEAYRFLARIGYYECRHQSQAG